MYVFTISIVRREETLFLLEIITGGILDCTASGGWQKKLKKLSTVVGFQFVTDFLPNG